MFDPNSDNQLSNCDDFADFYLCSNKLSIINNSLVLVKPRLKIQAKMTKVPFPQSLRFCHDWLAPGGVPGVRYAEQLSELFYLHWERFCSG